jgi:hypothetical protein
MASRRNNLFKEKDPNSFRIPLHDEIKERN